jgi:phospholipid/cholesterol/gamma-HCH transport system substrate-binding protein
MRYNNKIENIILENHELVATLFIQDDISLQEDTIGSIRTKGLLGEKYVEITPGGSDNLKGPGGIIRETELPIDLEKAIRRLVLVKFNKPRCRASEKKWLSNRGLPGIIGEFNTGETI